MIGRKGLNHTTRHLPSRSHHPSSGSANNARKPSRRTLTARLASIGWIDAPARLQFGRLSNPLLDERGVPREIERKPGKLARIPLHDRIVRFQEGDPEPGKLLLAIRVIGNVGTHRDDITFDDLLTGYEILDHVIDLVYSGRAARVAGLADEVLTRLAG